MEATRSPVALNDNPINNLNSPWDISPFTQPFEFHAWTLSWKAQGL